MEPCEPEFRVYVKAMTHSVVLYELSAAFSSLVELCEK